MRRSELRGRPHVERAAGLAAQALAQREHLRDIGTHLIGPQRPAGETHYLTVTPPCAEPLVHLVEPVEHRLDR